MVPTEPIPTAPLTVNLDNCGTIVEFTTAPERVITIKSTSTEMLLALGLGDRIIGTAFQDGPADPEWADDAAGLTVMSDKVPAQEAVLEAAPDLVYGGWESNFSAEGAGERESLESLGIHTLVSPAACKEEGYKPSKLSFDDIFNEIAMVGAIFRTDASELIASQRAVVEAIEPDTRGLSALWYSSGTDTPYVGAGIGAPQLMLETVGLDNIAGEIADTWSPFSWEAVVDANPDVIVLVDASWNTAAAKIEMLESNPATANLDAVINSRYLVVPFPAAEAGVRSAAAASDLSQQLATLNFE
ncbi:MAG: putative F420-0 ABC transporter substrate-binding protein [Microbacteriaceae bacterium]